MDKQEQMRQLVAKLNKASDAYYNGNSELMTDFEWDAMFDRLKQLEEDTGEILPNSPTHKVSEDTLVGQKEEHEFAALSLAKTKSVQELAKWSEGKGVWISWKLDGLTLVVTYDNGILTKVVTRGNGHVGTNITHLAPAINGILPKVQEKGHLVIRGEAVISYEDFEQFILENDADYANPRNLASGSLTLKDIEEVKQRHITWIPFTLVYTEHSIPSWGKRMSFLREQGFNVVESQAVARPQMDSIQATIDSFTEKVTNKQNPYPVDGLVVVYDDTAYAASGSVTGHHATRAGLAFKWQDESADTILDHIEWSCAANKISPVAVFSPVELEGTTVRRASLCNISECERLGIGGSGSKLQVIKANKIIPKVINVTETAGILAIPEICPVCGAPTSVVVSDRGIKTLHCMNHDCTAKQLKKFARLVSKEGLNIDGISEQYVARFINENFIKEYADIYHLKEHTNEIASFEGFGKKSVRNILDSIEKSRQTDGVHLLYALNIPLCGLEVAKRLMGRYDFSTLVTTARTTSHEDEFASIDGIGPEKSSKFISWMKNDTHYMHLQNLLKELQIQQEDKSNIGIKCANLTFVITGDVHIYKNRNELKAYIERQGGKVTGSVSKHTNFLINNDATSGSTKNKKAHELGIEIITEEQFQLKFAE